MNPSERALDCFCNMVPHSRLAFISDDLVPHLEAAIRAAVEQEREECAQMIGEAHKVMPGSPTFDEALAVAARAIRARGNP